MTLCVFSQFFQFTPEFQIRWETNLQIQINMGGLQGPGRSCLQRRPAPVLENKKLIGGFSLPQTEVSPYLQQQKQQRHCTYMLKKLGDFPGGPDVWSLLSGWEVVLS